MRNLLVASTGGHLAELHRLRPRILGEDEEAVWVTPDSDQSRSLLRGESVVHVRDVPPRAYAAVLANSLSAVRIVRGSGAERVISTGAGIALSFLPLARALGLSCHYIESAARITGPSTTGRLLRASGTAHLYTQTSGPSAPVATGRSGAPWSPSARCTTASTGSCAASST